MTRAVLWDLDGTLIDSEELHWLAWRDTMEAEGIGLTHEQFLSTFGQRNDSILPRWLPLASSARRIQVGHAKEESYRSLVRRTGIVALPGAAAWVQRLSREGWRQAVASSAPRANIEVVLEVLGLAQFFAATVSAEDVEHGKPAPDVFLAAAARLNVPPSRCIVVEDAAAGVEAACRAGMRNIGVGRNAAVSATVGVSSLQALPGDAFQRLLDMDL